MYDRTPNKPCARSLIFFIRFLVLHYYIFLIWLWITFFAVAFKRCQWYRLIHGNWLFKRTPLKRHSIHKNIIQSNNDEFSLFIHSLCQLTNWSFCTGQKELTGDEMEKVWEKKIFIIKKIKVYSLWTWNKNCASMVDRHAVSFRRISLGDMTKLNFNKINNRFMFDLKPQRNIAIT